MMLSSIRSSSVCFAFFLAASVGCGDDSGTPADATDAGLDAHVDSGSDADAGPDSGTPPGGVTVTLSGPSATSDASASFSFTCPAEASCTFTCALDDAAPSACASPMDVPLPNEGTFVFHVEATTSDSRTGSAQQTVRVDRTEPSLVSVEFTAYDELRLTFDEAIDASSLDVTNFSITAKPTGMAVHSVTAAGAVVLVRLSRHHLPWNGYRLSFTASDEVLNPLVVTDHDLTSALRSRLAFATTTTVDGSIPLPGGVACSATTGLGRADCICQHEATQAGMVGTFRAALSATGQDAFCRMRGLEGTEANNCGMDSSVTLPAIGPWVRADGLPVSGAYPNDSRGIFYAHPAMELDETFTSAAVWTGSDDELHAGSAHCSDWSTGGAGTGVHGYPGASRLPFMWSILGSTCPNTNALLCVQVDPNGPQTTSIVGIPLEARRIFVSSTRSGGLFTHSSGATGLAAADAICTDLANAAGLPSSTGYVALLSDGDDDAFCRLLGRTGERGSNDCGATAQELASGPFVSVHGHVLAANATELFATGAREPYLATEAGAFQYVTLAWSGLSATGDATSSASCADWTLASGGGAYAGAPYKGSTDWMQGAVAGGACSSSGALICVQR